MWRFAFILLTCLGVNAQERVPWTTSKLVGSPEPPLPFLTERAFPKLPLTSPIYLIQEPGTDTLWVIFQGGEPERPSKILSFTNDPDVADDQLILEQPGHLIYGLTFDPNYRNNRFVYVFANGPTGNPKRTNTIHRYRLNDARQLVEPLLIIEWASAGHDGGDLAFGNDGMLYITTGDGTGDSDLWNSGQSVDDLLGAVLRIDVREEPYSVPPDNPFVDFESARPEIWAYGLRNPWRLDIDRQSGQVWLGNNGQDLWETVHLVRPGENYGWSVYEGSYPFYQNRQLGPTPHVKPTVEHHHAEARSLTGGVVYRGEKFPELDGAYIYGDYSTGRIWGAKHDGEKLIWSRELADTTLQIAAFRAVDGELYVVDHGGSIHRFVRNRSAVTDDPPFPRRLGETGLYTSTKEHAIAPGVVPYEVNAPAWHDGAEASRWIALPHAKQIRYAKGSRAGEFPDGTALVQTLERDGQRIETRIQLKQDKEWAGYSYRWHADQSDAVLVGKEGEAIPEINWHIPSRAECASCHSRAANYVLGITGQQWDVADQLTRLSNDGLFSHPVADSTERPPPLVNPYDSTAPLDERARAYLHVNCAMCHVEAGGGNAMMDLSYGAFATERARVIGARPQHATFGLTDAMLVAPGAPERSVLAHRLSLQGMGQMPPLGRRQVDEDGLEMIRQWIASQESDHALVKAWSLTDFEHEIAAPTIHRSFLSGKKAFESTGCTQCHRLAGEGGVVGPDLSGHGARQSPHELLQSILTPSHTITEARYQVPNTDPPLSLMPAGMVNSLTKEEVLDLVAYLKHDGRPRVAAIVTEYRHNSHADIIVSRLFQTDTLDGKGAKSPLQLASLYTDQVPDSDTSRKFSTEYGFPIYDTIAEALTLGTGQLAVDGVLLIAEHGQYPKSETGNTQYPKRRFWEGMLDVFEESGRVVPVFVDKHLADNWADAKFIYDSAEAAQIPLMAGSSLPTSWRRPAADVRRNAKLKQLLTITYGSTDAYGFHALEFAQALAEQRSGGETGISSVRLLENEAVWNAFEGGLVDQELFAAAWARLEHPRRDGNLEALRSGVPNPLLFIVEHADGLISHFLELNGAAGEWAAAWRYGDDAMESSLFWTQEGRPGMHFTWLLNGIERMILTGKPSWNPERTLMTSGALDALLISRSQGGKRILTPYLEALHYQPTWRWTEPPPPPPMRPWSEQ